MIDIHSHLLPLVDDGSASIESSIRRLKDAQNSGVTDIILTPHYKSGYRKTPQELREIFSKFNEEKIKQNVSVNLYLGNEILYGKNTRKTLKEQNVLTLNGTKFVLIEFDYFNVTDVTEVVYGLVRDGFTPIVAHVERYSYVSIGDIAEMKNLGGLIQVNASSFVGECSLRLKRRVKKLFKEDLVDFVASDEHVDRKNNLQLAKDYVTKKFGSETATRVFVENAKKIIGQA